MVEICDRGVRKKHSKKHTVCFFCTISVQFPNITSMFSEQKTQCVFVCFVCFFIRKSYWLCSEIVQKLYRNCTEKTHCVFFTVFFSYPPLSQNSTILKTAIMAEPTKFTLNISL